MKEIKRIKFLNVPVDIAEKDEVEKIFENIVRQNNEKHQIVLLTIGKLIKAKFSKEYAQILEEASLILPVSRGIIKGVQFHKKGDIPRYNPYEFIIKILSILERFNKEVYILGAKPKILLEAEKNLRVSFPGLKFIGRCSGYFKKAAENDIKTSIRKSAPVLTLGGKGLPGKEKWLYRNMKDFNPGIFLWIDNYLDIFAGKDKNISKKMFNIGLESLTGLFSKPWRIFKIFQFFYFKILVLFYKILGK